MWSAVTAAATAPCAQRAADGCPASAAVVKRDRSTAAAAPYGEHGASADPGEWAATDSAVADEWGACRAVAGRRGAGRAIASQQSAAFASGHHAAWNRNGAAAGRCAADGSAWNAGQRGADDRTVWCAIAWRNPRERSARRAATADERLARGAVAALAAGNDVAGNRATVRRCATDGSIRDAGNCAATARSVIARDHATTAGRDGFAGRRTCATR